MQMQLRNPPSLFTIMPAAADQGDKGGVTSPFLALLPCHKDSWHCHNLPAILSTGYSKDPEWQQLPAAQPAHTLPLGNRAEG